MNEQDDLKTDNQQSLLAGAAAAESLADLPLTDAQAEAAKAGIAGGSTASNGEIPWQVSVRH